MLPLPRTARVQAAIEAYNKAQMEQYDKAIERKIKNLELEAKKKAIEDYINPEVSVGRRLPSLSLCEALYTRPLLTAFGVGPY
jgi:hypothetical protein